MEEFFEYLNANGITAPPDILPSLAKMKPEKLMDFALRCYVLTERRAQPSAGTYNFAASSTISGGTHPCADMPCRVRNMQDLATFAALYADTVYILNPFEHIYRRIDSGFDFKSVDQFLIFLQQVEGDIATLINFKPLLLAGIVQINPQLQGYCKACWARTMKNQKKIWKEFEGIKDRVMKDVVKNIKFVQESPHSLVIVGPKDYMGDESYRFAITPKHLKKYAKKTPHTYSPKEIKDNAFWELVLLPAFEDMFVQKLCMNYKDATYITNRRIEGNIIKNLTGKRIPDTTEKTGIDAIGHELPFLQNASLKTLLDVRKDEPEAFIVYRDKLTKILQNNAKKDSYKSVKKVIQDEIRPELNKIDQIIKSHRDEFTNKGRRKVLRGSLGLSAGIFANHVGAVVFGTVMCGVSAQDIFNAHDDFSQAKQLPSEARNRDFYYLWKVNALSKF